MTAKRRVAIIGAGTAGVCAAKHAHAAGHEVTVYDQQHDVGGTWMHSPIANMYSNAYDELHTIVPVQLMTFAEPQFTTSSRFSFVAHSEVHRYLQETAKPIRHLICFNTTVLKVEPINGTDKWNVRTKPMSPFVRDGFLIDSTVIQSAAEKEEEFDAVFVCNGHYRETRLPKFVDELRLPWIHSHDFRRPCGYASRVVAIVGAGFSGIDIASQIGRVTEKVYFLHNKEPLKMAANIQQLPGVKSIGENGRTLILFDGTELTDVDDVIFCTGYRYAVPFLDKSIIEAKEDGRYLSPLYMQFAHTRYPRSLFLIGLNSHLNLFAAIEYQIWAGLAFMEGRTPVPNQKELDDYEQNRLKQMKKDGTPMCMYHAIGACNQVEFFKKLALIGEKESPAQVLWDMWDHVDIIRAKYLHDFKKYCIRVKGEQFECTREPERAISNVCNDPKAQEEVNAMVSNGLTNCHLPYSSC